MVYVAALNGGNITAIDPQTQRVSAEIQSKPGIVSLRFESNGRFAFAVNQLESTVSVVDSATNKWLATANVAKEPDQIIFTEHYAYLRGLGSEKFSLIELDNARNGHLQPLEIQAGQLAPEKEAAQIGFAPMMVATPDGNSVMIANAPDRMTYFYQEGMMAPMGTFSNYQRMSRGLMILDQSLSESAPGVYTAAVHLPHAGHFDVPVLLDQPRIMHCFQVSLDEAAGQQKAQGRTTVQIDLVQDHEPIIAGKPHVLQFSISDSINHHPISGLKGVGILVFRPPGTWQQRNTLTELGGGVYEWQLSFPTPGHYKILFNLPSQKIRWGDLPSKEITVTPGPT
jgi:YVTN family beta-propeller protein